MKTAQEVLINFHILIKNRLGPYKIVVKNEDGDYWSTTEGRWTKNIYRAHEYGYYPGNDFGSKWATYVTTAAGDIKILSKDYH